jgi:hypothetical protein
MTFFYAPRTFLIVLSVIAMSSCRSRSGPPPILELGGWPPVSSACVRTDPVASLYQLGQELTRVHADPHCVSQTNCVWIEKSTREFDDDAVGAKLWENYASQPITLAQQDDIVARARWHAHLLRPVSRNLYRLTFDFSIVTSGSTDHPSAGEITATAYYGECAYTVDSGTVVRKIGDVPVHD